MGRVLALLAVVATLIAVAVLLFRSSEPPQVPQRRAQNTITVEAPRDRRPPLPDTPPSPAPTQAAAPAQPTPPSAAAPAAAALDDPADPEARADDAAGPAEVSLGRHKVTVKAGDPTQPTQLEFELVARVDSPETAQQVQYRYRDFVRMQYLLASHRSEGALHYPDAADRFARDMLKRVRNVVQVGEIYELRAAHWQLIEP